MTRLPHTTNFGHVAHVAQKCWLVRDDKGQPFGENYRTRLKAEKAVRNFTRNKVTTDLGQPLTVEDL